MDIEKIQKFARFIIREAEEQGLDKHEAQYAIYMLTQAYTYSEIMVKLNMKGGSNKV
jgi:hypothetical protein